jgi:hypothetical protein
MKRFRVRLTQEIEISFDDDRATATSARYVAEKTWGARALVGDFGTSTTLGRWDVELTAVDVEEPREVRDEKPSRRRPRA